MDSQLVVKPHPFTFEGHETTIAPFLPRETLGAYLERNAVALPRSDFEVWHNGHRVPHALWDKLRPRTGDTIVIAAVPRGGGGRSEEHTSELQSRGHLVCRLLLEKKKIHV